MLARGTRIRLRDLEATPAPTCCSSGPTPPGAAQRGRHRQGAVAGVPRPGHPLLSDAGRVLATVVADTSGHHDALCGTTSAAANRARYGDGPCTRRRPPGGSCSPSPQPSTTSPPGPAAVAVLLPRHPGRHRRALVSTGTAGAGRTSTCCLHLPVIVLVANTAHPLDPAPEFRTTSLELLAWTAAEELDVLRNDDPEYRAPSPTPRTPGLRCTARRPLEGKDA
ncbi:DUF1989 domain-containing protein [Rhodococcus hoagii]|nr:DUF1989 domain-containing protein [Prescottella equi]